LPVLLYFITLISCVNDFYLVTITSVFGAA
jgi:hypothetical protein